MRAAAFCAVLLLAAACSRAPADTPVEASDSPSPGPATTETLDLPDIQATEAGGAPIGYPSFRLGLRPPDGGDGVELRVYDADDDAARAHGLMGVSDLDDDAGMLFRFAQPRTGGFWMKNTLIPLSIAFAGADGTIHSILDMEPCTADPCPVYTPDAVYFFALEVPQGAFTDHGVAEGWVIEVPDDLPPAT